MNCLVAINLFDPDAERCAGIIAGFIRRNVPDESTVTLLMCQRNANTYGTNETADSENTIASRLPASRIISIKSDICFPQTAASFISDSNERYDIVLTPGNDFGNALAAHLEGKLDGTALTCVTAAELTDNCCVCSKRIYAGHVCGKYRLDKRPYILSVDKCLSAEPGSTEIPGELTIEHYNVEESIRVKDVEMHCPESDSELEKAECIVVCGRGVNNKAHTEEITALAEKTSIPIAGSRPCVMNAWMPMTRMIGVSGKILHPRISILLGVSGAPAFYEGIKNSDYIIAVNNDSEAPIKNKSDLFIQGDCMDVFRSFADLLTE